MSSPIWHPFTQHALHPVMRPIVSGEGSWLTDAAGKRVFDAISSWWVITHGHCHPAIVEAIRAQAGQLDQVIFAGYTHPAAEAFAAALLQRLPSALSRMFFSDSGSTSVEVAIKMALGHFRHRGEARSRIAVLQHGYHGDTVGTMSVGERGVFSQPYDPLLFAVTRLPFPTNPQTTLDALVAAAGQGDLAALVVEPLVLGAGGMLFYPPQVLAQMAEICAHYGVLLIADEVMTGWGRTGRFLACDHAAVVPDILCLSKGITGGALPLAVTCCREDIYDSHWSEDLQKTFFHSSSYTANPIACAAGVANLAIWRDEPVQERIDAICAHQAAGATRLAGHARLTGARAMGTILAAEIGAGGYLSDLGPKLLRFFSEHNLLIRPLGNTVYLLPPYCATVEDLTRCHDAILEAADAFG